MALDNLTERKDWITRTTAAARLFCMDNLSIIFGIARANRVEADSCSEDHLAELLDDEVLWRIACAYLFIATRFGHGGIMFATRSLSCFVAVEFTARLSNSRRVTISRSSVMRRCCADCISWSNKPKAWCAWAKTSALIATLSKPFRSSRASISAAFAGETADEGQLRAVRALAEAQLELKRIQRLSARWHCGSKAAMSQIGVSGPHRAATPQTKLKGRCCDDAMCDSRGAPVRTSSTFRSGFCCRSRGCSGVTAVYQVGGC